MNFKEITVKDHKRLILFWKKNYFISEMDSKEKLKLFLSKNPNLSILAEDNKNIVGTALGSFDGRRGYIQKVVVDTSFRKKGLGKKLVEKVVSKLKLLGVTYIPVSVEKELVHFYEDSGFKETTQTPMALEIK